MSARGGSPRAWRRPWAASRSARSLPASPEWPFTQTQRTSRRAASSSRRCISSTFFTGPVVVRQPLSFQPRIHSVTDFTTYWLSHRISIAAPSGKCSSARIAAVSSMRLLVLCVSPPHSSIGPSGAWITTPQPPGPGLGSQPPSA